MKLTVVGSGDAFGVGGRLQACFHVDTGERAFLIDCGVTSIMGMDRLGLDQDRVDTILVSHLHGDHFGGLVWWLIHALYVKKRVAPLTVAGPKGIEARFLAAAEALYPDSTKVPRRFDLQFVEVAAGPVARINGLDIVAYPASHPSGAPSHLMRIGVGGRVIAFSGDTEWVDDLIPCQAGADAFICECQMYRTPIRYHLNWGVLETNLARLSAKRVLIAHMGAEMLARSGEVLQPPLVAAHDGMVVEI